jgi:hypothetical protein
MSRAKIVTVASTAALAAAGSFVGMLPAPAPVTSELVAYQGNCLRAHAFLISYLPVATNGAQFFTAGEAHRPAWVAKINAATGKGIASSIHVDRLAFDLMLIKDGQYTPRGEDYRQAGEIWEAIGSDFGVRTAWGGRFNDANHFSCAWGGRR